MIEMRTQIWSILRTQIWSMIRTQMKETRTQIWSILRTQNGSANSACPSCYNERGRIVDQIWVRQMDQIRVRVDKIWAHSTDQIWVRKMDQIWGRVFFV